METLIHHLKKIALAADSAQVERSCSIPLCKIKRGQQKAAVTVVPADLRNRKIQFPAASQLLSKRKSQQEVGFIFLARPSPQAPPRDACSAEGSRQGQDRKRLHPQREWHRKAATRRGAWLKQE